MVTSLPGLSSLHQFLHSPFKRAQLGSQSYLASPSSRQTVGPVVSTLSWLFPGQMSSWAVPRSDSGSVPVLPTLWSSSPFSGSTPQRGWVSSWASSCWGWSVSSLWSSLRWASTLRSLPGVSYRGCPPSQKPEPSPQTSYSAWLAPHRLASTSSWEEQWPKVGTSKALRGESPSPPSQP